MLCFFIAEQPIERVNGMEALHVLIVEDDFRVADINRQQIEQIEGFHVLEVVKTAADALEFLQRTSVLPHVVVVDVYIPDSPGLHLFWQIRRHYPLIDIVIVSAVKKA